jgi:hypothetical protein
VDGKVLKTLWQERSQLRELEISGKVSKISKSIGQLKHLERIFFRDGSFQKLPKEFCNMKLFEGFGVRRVLKTQGATRFFW